MHAQADRLDSFFDSIPDEALAVLPDDVAVVFELTGDGGGTWSVRTAAGDTEITRGTVDHPDARLTCTVTDFDALLRGSLDPRAGFLAGQLEVEGDVGLVLVLHRSVAQPER